MYRPTEKSKQDFDAGNGLHLKFNGSIDNGRQCDRVRGLTVVTFRGRHILSNVTSEVNYCLVRTGSRVEIFPALRCSKE